MTLLSSGLTPARPTTLVPATVTTLYFSASGNNANSGTSTGSPKQTIAHLNTLTLAPGTVVSFKGGDTFSGEIYASSGVTYNSYGTGKAIISPAAAENGVALWDDVYGVTVDNLKITGVGALATGSGVNAQTGLANTSMTNIKVTNCEISNTNYGIVFGVDLSTAHIHNVLVEDCYIHDVLGSAAEVYGVGSVNDTSGITFRRSVAKNCGRDGFLIGYSTQPLIEYCVASNCGTAAGGRVGIWFYIVDGGTIQWCESFDNVGTPDGDGFDLDQGCKNCTIQYCYSHDNRGAGYLVYVWTNTWDNNTIRYCLSENDGDNSTYAGITLGSNGQSLGSVYVYGNTVYQSIAGKKAFNVLDQNPKGRVVNNIFVTNNATAILADVVPVTPNANLFITGNNWYALSTTIFKYNGTTYASLTALQAALASFEKVSGTNVGVTANPSFVAPGTMGTLFAGSVITEASWRAAVALATNYQFTLAASPMVNAGRDLIGLYTYNPGVQDFWGNELRGGTAWSLGAYDKGWDAAAAGITIGGYTWSESGTQFFRDTFTDTAGTDLNAHTSDSGHTWARNAASSGGAGKTSGSRVYSVNTGISYQTSPTPPSANQRVYAAMDYQTTVASQDLSILLRHDTTVNTGYLFGYSQATGAWRISKVVSSTVTNLGSFTEALTVGNVYSMKAEANGTTLTLSVNGVSKVTLTDSSISAVNRVGIRNTGAATAAATGLGYDEYVAYT